MNIRNWIIKYRDFGILAIPIHIELIAGKNSDYKEKKIRFPHTYSNEKPLSDDEIDEKINQCEANAVAIVCGQVSGSIEAVDIEGKTKGIDGDELLQLIRDDLDKSIYDKLLIVKSPGGGYHFIYRSNACNSKANAVLTERFVGDKIKTAIELRGEKGLILSFPPNDGYELMQGNYGEIPIIEDNEREALLRACYILNHNPQASNFSKKSISDDKINVPVVELLEAIGWTVVGEDGFIVKLRRPGATSGKSAIYNKDTGIFYVFSTGDEVFEGMRGYHKIQVLAKLKFQDDLEAARGFLGLKDDYISHYPNLILIDDIFYEFNLIQNSPSFIRIGKEWFDKEHRGNKKQSQIKDQLYRAGRYLPRDQQIDREVDRDIDSPKIEIINHRCIIKHPIAPDLGDYDEYIFLFLRYLFKDYIEFILDWLAVYAYGNGERLPILILTGNMGIGKGTFGNFLETFYPNHTSKVKNASSDFNPWYISRFWWLDEVEKSEVKKIYEEMKFISGNTTGTVNEKRIRQYHTTLKTQVLMTSNDRRPLYVEPSEMPVSEDNNRWFFLHLSEDWLGKKKPLKPGDVRLIEKGVGHFAKFFLWDRYNAMTDGQKARNRFTIPTPITIETMIQFKEGGGLMRDYAMIVATALKEHPPVNGLITKAKLMEVMRNNNIGQSFCNAVIGNLQKEKFLSYERVESSDSFDGAYKVLMDSKTDINIPVSEDVIPF